MLASFEPGLAAVIATAMRGYGRALDQEGRAVPAGFQETQAALEVLAARSGQLLVRGGAVLDAGRAVSSSTCPGQRLALSMADAAALTGLGERTIRRYIADGKLPAQRLGGRVLIDPNDLANLVSGER